MILGKDRRRVANLITENEKLKGENKNLLNLNQELKRENKNLLNLNQELTEKIKDLDKKLKAKTIKKEKK